MGRLGILLWTFEAFAYEHATDSKKLTYTFGAFPGLTGSWDLVLTYKQRNGIGEGPVGSPTRPCYESRSRG